MQRSQSTSLLKDYSFELYRAVADLPDAWSDLVQSRNNFLDIPFLTAIEKSPPIGLENRYVILKSKNRAVGVVLLQLIEYRLKETLKNLAPEEVKTKRQKLSYRGASVMYLRLLVVGE